MQTERVSSNYGSASPVRAAAGASTPTLEFLGFLVICVSAFPVRGAVYRTQQVVALSCCLVRRLGFFLGQRLVRWCLHGRVRLHHARGSLGVCARFGCAAHDASREFSAKIKPSASLRHFCLWQLAFTVLPGLTCRSKGRAFSGRF